MTAPQGTVATVPSPAEAATDTRLGDEPIPALSILAGATGLVGQSIAHLAGEHCLSLVRGSAIPGQLQVDYENLDASLGDHLRPGRVYCALGTTIRKAGSHEAFRRVDLDYPLALARWARRQGCPDFRLVSSVGADPRSSAFYLKTKGELESALAQSGFEQLHIFRPGVLVGQRVESRPGEAIGKWLSTLLGPLLLGGLSKYRAIPAQAVAKAMIAAPSAPGVHVYHFQQINQVSKT